MKDCDFGCEDHGAAFPHHKHPDGSGHGDKHAKHLHEHMRAAPHPQYHSSGKMPAQMNPDHGPHHHKP